MVVGGRLSPVSRVFGPHVLAGHGGEVDRLDRDGSPPSRASAAGPQPHAGIRERFVRGPWLLMGRTKKANQTLRTISTSTCIETDLLRALTSLAGPRIAFRTPHKLYTFHMTARTTSLVSGFHGPGQPRVQYGRASSPGDKILGVYTIKDGNI